MTSTQKKKMGGFSQFFSKQRTKVSPKEPVGKVLTQFAEEDLKRIAVLMQEWLSADEKQRQKNTARAQQSRNRKTR